MFMILPKSETHRPVSRGLRLSRESCLVEGVFPGNQGLFMNCVRGKTGVLNLGETACRRPGQGRRRFSGQESATRSFPLSIGCQ